MTPLKLFSILITLVLMTGCNKNSMPAGSISNTIGQKMLSLGDSYTIGQSVSAAERFPEKTVAILRSQGLSIADPRIIATTGWTTANLLSAINAASPGNDYAVVTLLIGVNNQYQGRSIDEYRSEFTTLLARSIQFAGNRKSRVFVLSIPDYSVTPFAQGYDTAAIAHEIDMFNAVNKEVALAYGVNYLDITPISREGRYDNSLQAGDGLHPSGKQYQRWADLLAPMIRSSL